MTFGGGFDAILEGRKEEVREKGNLGVGRRAVVSFKIFLQKRKSEMYGATRSSQGLMKTRAFHLCLVR